MYPFPGEPHFDNHRLAYIGIFDHFDLLQERYCELVLFLISS